VSAVLLAACASTPPPTEQLAVTNAAVARAAGAGGPEYAPAEMGLAREKLNRANVAIAAKDNDRALALLQQSQLDAQLAEAKAEATKAQKAADALAQSSQALREEMARKTNQPKP
jgi:hypothetical protein